MSIEKKAKQEKIAQTIAQQLTEQLSAQLQNKPEEEQIVSQAIADRADKNNMVILYCSKPLGAEEEQVYCRGGINEIMSIYADDNPNLNSLKPRLNSFC